MKQLTGALKLIVLEEEKIVWKSIRNGVSLINIYSPSGKTLSKSGIRKKDIDNITIKGYLVSEVAEDQASKIVPDWKTIRPYGALGVFQEMVKEQLKENKLELRVGKRPEVGAYVAFSIGNIVGAKHFFAKALKAHDNAVHLTQIIVQT